MSGNIIFNPNGPIPGLTGTSGTTSTTSTTPTGTNHTDSTSSARGTGRSSNRGYTDPDSPVIDPSKMSSADIMAAISLILSRANRQRRVSDQDGSKLTFTTTLVNVKHTYTTTTPDNSSGNPSGTVGTSTGTSTNVNVNAEADTTVDGEGEGKTVTRTEILTEMRGHMTLSATLSDAVNEVLEKKLKKKIPHTSFNMLQNYLNALATSAQGSIILPALASLGNIDAQGTFQPGKTSFRDDQKAVDTALAVQFQKLIGEAIASGQIKELTQAMMPDDPAGARQLAASLEIALLDVSQAKVGEAAGLSGLGRQVILQAKVLRQENTVLSEKPNQVVDKVITKLISEGKISENQRSLYEEKAARALEAFNAGGPYTSRQDLTAALQTHFNNQFRDNNELANAFAVGVDRAAVEIATDGQSLYLPTLNPADVKVDKTFDSIKKSILAEFAENLASVNAASKAQAIVDDVLSDARLGRFKSEQEIRDAIATAVKREFAGAELIPEREITAEELNALADRIAAGANFGIPPNEHDPLLNADSDLVIAPWVYDETVRTNYQNTTGISPNSLLGLDLDQAAGITTGDNGVNVISLFNQAYLAADTDTRSYLNAPPREAAEIAHINLTDPGAALINLGNLMNSSQSSDTQAATFV